MGRGEWGGWEGGRRTGEGEGGRVAGEGKWPAASRRCGKPHHVVEGRWCMSGILPLVHCSLVDRLVGQVVRRPPRERKVPGSNPACAGIFLGSSHTSDLKIGTPVATLPGSWHYRVSTGTGRPGVSILWLGEVERWICNFCLKCGST